MVRQISGNERGLMMKRVNDCKKIIVAVGMVFLLIMLNACTASNDYGDISQAQQTEEIKTTASDYSSATGAKEVLSVQWDYAGPYSEGYAVVGMLDGENMKYNYIDFDGKLISDYWYDHASAFSCGMAVVGNEIADPNGGQMYEYGYINTSGELAIPMIYRGNTNIRPRDFYPKTQMAEVNWINEDGKDCANLINKDGELFFAFTVSKTIGYGGGPEDPRLLTINWSHDYNLMVNFAFEPTWMQGIDGIYWVDAGGNVLHSVRSEIYDVYYIRDDVLALDGSAGVLLFDEKGNQLSGQCFENVRSGMGDHLLIYSTDSLGGQKIGVYDGGFKEVIAPQVCNNIEMSTEWYFFVREESGERTAEQYSKDGVRKGIYAGYNVQSLEYCEYNDGRFRYITLPCYVLEKDGKYTLFDETGKELYTSNSYMSAASVKEVKFNLDEEDYFGIYDLSTNEMKKYPVKEALSGEGSLSGNKTSMIYGTDFYNLSKFEQIKLMTSEKELIEQADALSLVKDGFYKRGVMKYDEEFWNASLSSVTLCKVGDKSFVCKEYEDLGVLSEGRIAYKKDGKWGYLELVAQ